MHAEKPCSLHRACKGEIHRLRSSRVCALCTHSAEATGRGTMQPLQPGMVGGMLSQNACTYAGDLGSEWVGNRGCCLVAAMQDGGISSHGPLGQRMGPLERQQKSGAGPQVGNPRQRPQPTRLVSTAAKQVKTKWRRKGARRASRAEQLGMQHQTQRTAFSLTNTNTEPGSVAIATGSNAART